MLKQLILAATTTLFAANIASADETRATGAQLQVQDLGQIKVHAYAAPENMSVPLADDYRLYADSLNKPINRLLLTHGRPDHYLGLIVFKDVPNDVPNHVLPSSVKEVAETGEATRC